MRGRAAGIVVEHVEPSEVVEHVEPSELIDGRTDHRLKAVGVGHVCADRDCLVASEMSSFLAGLTSISAMATLAPSRANRMAVARPIPAPAPVMNAIFPASRGIDLSPGLRYSDHHWQSARREHMSFPVLRPTAIDELLGRRTNDMAPLWPRAGERQPAGRALRAGKCGARHGQSSVAGIRRDTLGVRDRRLDPRDIDRPQRHPMARMSSQDQEHRSCRAVVFTSLSGCAVRLGCARGSARRQVGTKGWSFSIEQRDAAFDLNSASPRCHDRLAELDAHNCPALC